MAQVHYFPRYSQRENFETNNTLLLLRQLYNYNRFRFERFLSALLHDADREAGGALELGLQIKQQVGTGAGIVDGYLYQDSFRIVIETKRRGDSFDAEQLRRHLSGFSQSNGGFLFMLSPERARIEGPNWADLAGVAKAKNVTLLPVTFENLIAAARGCLNNYDEEMLALVADYEDFCSEDELLPVDKWTLFVPPCGQSHEINVAQKLYFCPASWSRRKARYLGVYYDKAVRHIGAIAKVVESEVRDGNTVSETVPLTSDERQRVAMASRAAMDQNEWNLTTGYQFFLCDEMAETFFEKSSSGGIMGHRYFDLRDYFSGGVPTQLAEIAKGLPSRKWE